MFIRKWVGVVVVLLGLAACGSTQPSVVSSGPDGIVRSYSISDMVFSAPADLSVSESEEFYPIADVIWRGETRGNRVEQIAAMFETALDRNKTRLSGDQPVVVDIQLVRFHGVTDRTRYSVGGVYNIVFNMRIRDAGSGAVIEPYRRVGANLPAPGGSEAVRLEQSGQTQKVRVVDFLTETLRGQLS